MVKKILLGYDCNLKCDVCLFTETIDNINSIENYVDDMIDSEIVVLLNKSTHNKLPELVKDLKNLRTGKIMILLPNIDKKESKLIGYVKLTTSIHYVHKAIDSAIFLNKDIATVYIPHCFMIGYKRYMFENNPRKTDELSICKLFDEKKYGKIKVNQCNTCNYNSSCDGIWKAYLDRYGKKEILPANKNFIVTDNERCMVLILLKENNLSTKKILELKSSEEFRDICADCVSSDDVTTTGNNLIKKSIVEKRLGKDGYKWKLVRDYSKKLKERGIEDLFT